MLPKCEASILKKFPVSWRGLFNCTNRSDCFQLNKMKEWYRDQTSSRYGAALNWDDLLQSLVVEDPICTDTGLSFVLRFHQLPVQLQQSFLSFILDQRKHVPVSSLKSFVTVIIPNVQNDSWIDILCRMLEAYIKSNTEDRNIFSSQYCFTSKNENNVKQLQQKIQKTSPRYSPWKFKTCLNEDKPQTSPEDTQIDESFHGSSSDTPRVISPDCIMIDDEEPPIKVPKLDSQLSVQTQIEQSQITTMLDDSYCDIRTEDLDRMKALKEKWSNGEETEVIDEIDVLVSSSTSQVRRLCQEVSLEDLTETSISLACNHVIQRGTMISDGNCTELLSALLLRKLIDMNQSASRILSGVICTAAENFSKPFIDAVFVPATNNSTLNTFQADLMIKICKEVFSNSSRVYFLEQIFKCQTEITDNLIAVLQTIFDCKPDIEDSLLLMILQTMKEQGNQQEKNLKFGKLILALINKYGRQMTKEHKEILSHISMIHKSFLKKSIQSAVSKL